MIPHQPATWVAGISVAIDLINDLNQLHPDLFWKHYSHVTKPMLIDAMLTAEQRGEIQSVINGCMMQVSIEVYDDWWKSVDYAPRS